MSITSQLSEAYKKNGLQGISGIMNELEKSSLFFKLFSWVDKRFLGNITLLHETAKLEHRLAFEPLLKPATEFLKQINVAVKSNSKIPNELIQTDSPVIIYGNHETSIEPWIIISLMRRNDIKFIGLISNYYVGENAKKFVFPVIPKKYAYERNKYKFRVSMDFIADFMYRLKLSEQKIEEINYESIKNAAKSLENNNALFIFPTENIDITSEWKTGIGRIISLLNSEMKTKTKLLPFRISGITHKQVKNNIKKTFTSKKTNMLTAAIEFGEIRSISDLIADENDTDRITQMIYNNYTSQFYPNFN